MMVQISMETGTLRTVAAYFPVTACIHLLHVDRLSSTHSWRVHLRWRMATTLSAILIFVRLLLSLVITVIAVIFVCIWCTWNCWSLINTVCCDFSCRACTDLYSTKPYYVVFISSSTSCKYVIDIVYVESVGKTLTNQPYVKYSIMQPISCTLSTFRPFIIDNVR